MRRRLTFDSFEQASAEIDRLLSCDYRRAGEWDLGQMCDHLADSLHGSMHGFDFITPWLARMLFAKPALRYLMKRRRIPIRAKLPRRMEPAAGKDAARCAARLREKMREFDAWSQPLAAHPFFGRLGAEQWRQVHLIHMAHHLGFLLPQTDAITTSSARG
jgi:hypothetical protein